MGRIIGLVVLIGLVGGGVYLWKFKKADTERLALGYPKAETPQMAADYFKKAINARNYDMAALYCTAGYAEQLKRGNEAASKLGTAIDNVSYQMKERNVSRDEAVNAFYILDPFPKDVQITVGKESGDAAEGTIVFAGPGHNNDSPSSGSWSLKPEIFLVYVRSMKFTKPNTAVVPLKKENGEWKFDLAADKNLQLRVDYLNSKHAKYANALDQTSSEIKTDPTLKETAAAIARLKSLLESAAKE